MGPGRPIQLELVSHEAMIRTEMGGGGDHITKHGTHISRDMGPGGGPYISNDMGLPGPISLLHDIANLIVVARQLYTY